MVHPRILVTCLEVAFEGGAAGIGKEVEAEVGDHSSMIVISSVGGVDPVNHGVAVIEFWTAIGSAIWIESGF